MAFKGLRTELAGVLVIMLVAMVSGAATVPFMDRELGMVSYVLFFRFECSSLNCLAVTDGCGVFSHQYYFPDTYDNTHRHLLVSSTYALLVA
jgi:hypothetical protein